MKESSITYFSLWVDETLTSPKALEPQATFRTKVVSTPTDADIFLSDSTQGIAALVIDPIIKNPGGLELIARCRRERPLTPIIILYDRTPPFSRAEMDRLGVTLALPKSGAHGAVEELLANEVFDIRGPRPISPCKPNAEGFIPVPAGDLLTGTPATFDIYLKLPSGKYIKIVEAKDVFTPSRALGYIRKQVTHFYLSKEGYRRSIAYYDTLAAHFLKSREISLELKASHVLNEGERVLQLLRSAGSEAEKADFALGFVMSTQSLLKEIKLEDHEAIQAIVRHLPAYEHAVSTTLIAGLLGMGLEIEALSTFRVLGLAALLHDIGLYGMPASIQHGELEKMNEKERELYRTHPALGAKILESMPGMDDTVIQAVAQHHERRDNKGFPGLVPSKDINRMAEIVGLSGEFADLLSRQRVQPELELEPTLEAKVFDGYSLPVVEALRKIFLSRPRKK